MPQGLTAKLYIDDELVSECLCGDPELGLDGDVLPGEAGNLFRPVANRAVAAGKSVRIEVWDPDETCGPGPLAVVVFTPDKAKFN